MKLVLILLILTIDSKHCRGRGFGWSACLSSALCLAPSSSIALAKYASPRSLL